MPRAEDIDRYLRTREAVVAEVPDDAAEFAPNIGRIVARSGEEADPVGVQQGRMYGEELGVLGQQPPGAEVGGAIQVDLQIEHPVETLVARRWVIDEDVEQLGPAVAVEVGEGDSGALILPGEPSRHDNPGAPPARHPALTVQVPADLIRGLVGIGGVVDLEDHQFGATIAVEIGDRDPRSLVLPGKPVGPHPLAPAAGNLPVGIQVPTDPVIAGVQTGGTVDLEDHQLGATVAVEIGDRNSRSLGSPRRTSRERRSRGSIHP